VRRHPDFGPLLQTLWDELAGEVTEEGIAT